MSIKNIILAMFCLLAAGCSVFPKPDAVKASYYSIGEPESGIKLKHQITQVVVSSATGQHRQMLFKKNSEQLLFDNTNCWIEPPPVMVQRYLTLACSEPSRAVSSLQLSAELLTFSSNLPKQQSNIALLVTLRRDGKVVHHQLYQAHIKAVSNSAAGYAAAMHKAMTVITAKIIHTINSLR